MPSARAGGRSGGWAAFFGGRGKAQEPRAQEPRAQEGAPKAECVLVDVKTPA